MPLLWRAKSNPLALWWAILTLVSVANIAVWFLLYRAAPRQPAGGSAARPASS